MRNNWKGSRNEEMSGELLDKEIENVLGAARAWMEISPLENNSDRVQVGEPTMLSVKSTLPGIFFRVNFFPVLNMFCSNEVVYLFF